MPTFSYDFKKDRANEERHGISLAEARGLWDETHVIIPAKNVKGEGRWAILGRMEGRLYAAIFTERNAVIRIISCHRVDGKWERIYESQSQKKESH
ncbi:MAG TPA: BrnT family toxin [Elusimicrobiota bacterium]|nr:BrnT family toxin [Elusimicrobiota bacterium]